MRPNCRSTAPSARLCQRLRRAPRADQLDQLFPEFFRIWGMGLWDLEHLLFSKGQVPTRAGQDHIALQGIRSCNKRTLDTTMHSIQKSCYQLQQLTPLLCRRLRLCWLKPSKRPFRIVSREATHLRQAPVQDLTGHWKDQMNGCLGRSI